MENQNDTIKRKQIQKSTLYPMPNRMGQSSYRVEFNKYNKKDQADIHGLKFNIEVEVNKILTNVR